MKLHQFYRFRYKYASKAYVSLHFSLQMYFLDDYLQMRKTTEAFFVFCICKNIHKDTNAINVTNARNIKHKDLRIYTTQLNALIAIINTRTQLICHNENDCSTSPLLCKQSIITVHNRNNN